MPRVLRLLILPAVGLVFLLAAFLWSQRELSLRFLGEPAEGRIVGMVLERESGSDLLAALRTDLVLVSADGTRHVATYLDRRPDAATDAWLASAPAELARVVSDAALGDATRVRWALQREARRVADPLRIVRIERTDTLSAWLDLPAVPEVLAYADGRVRLPAPDAPAPAEVRIHAVFDRSDLAAVEARKGESLTDYAYERAGVAHTPAKRDFFLHAEPYQTQFRPVFAYTAADGSSVARLSHIGRHGGPTLALRLFEPCRVYFDPAAPANAVLTALPGPIDGNPLDWFSRLCEGVFAQWGATALIALAGCLFIATGALLASLALFPSKKITLS